MSFYEEIEESFHRKSWIIIWQESNQGQR